MGMKEKKTIKNLFTFLTRFFEDMFFKLCIPLFALLSMFLVIYLAITMPNSELKDILQAFAQLNVTVAIGIGTLAIAIKAPDNTKVEFIKEILTILIISVFCFFLSYIQHEWVQRIYIGLSGIFLIFILVTTSKYILGINSREGNKRKTTKRKKR